VPTAGSVPGHTFHAPSRGSTRVTTTGPAELVSVPPMSTTSAYTSDRGSGRPEGRQVLLRKEVIQPHLPVRLPCYDFVPIADPTFDSSLPEGLGHWLRVLPTFVT
jgi:hypothetical protein